MPKRSHMEFANGGTPLASPPTSYVKKTKTAKDDEDLYHTLTYVQAHADELINVLESLRSIRSQPEQLRDLAQGSCYTELKQGLLSLKKYLLPALLSLDAQGSQGDSGQNKAGYDLPKNNGNENTNKNQDAARDSKSPVIFSPITMEPWDPKSIPASLPLIVPVQDAALAKAALTHIGMTCHPTELSYERLEWIGDAYLYLISTALIYTTFPHHKPGQCAQLRELLVRNETLSKFTLAYGLDQRANFPAEFGLGGRDGGSSASSRERKKVAGDLFEAYVAAAILSDPADGLTRVAQWLKALWGQTIRQQITAEAHASPGGPARSQIDAKTELYKTIAVPGLSIKYEDIKGPKKDKLHNLPVFSVGIFVEGLGERRLQLGWGTALSKKEAGQKAARMALENKKLLKRFVQWKETFLEMKAVEKEAQEQAAAAAAAAAPQEPTGSSNPTEGGGE